MRALAAGKAYVRVCVCVCVCVCIRKYLVMCTCIHLIRVIFCFTVSASTPKRCLELILSHFPPADLAR